MKDEILKILNNNLISKPFDDYYSSRLKNQILPILDKYTYKFDYLEEKLKMYEKLIEHSNFAIILKEDKKVKVKKDSDKE